MKNSKKIDLVKLGDTSAGVRSMLNELEGGFGGQEEIHPQWPNRFISYQKAAPSRDKGERK